MRRFVQAFGLKRDKHDHNPSGDPLKPTSSQGQLSSKSSLTVLTLPFLSSSSSVKPSTPDTIAQPAHSPSSSSFSTPHLSSASSDPSSHSSGSSSGSASLHPDDDRKLNPTLTRSLTKRSWKSWIGGRRSASLKHRGTKDKGEQLPNWDPTSLSVAPSLLSPTFQSASLKDIKDEMQISSISDFESPPADEHVPASSSPMVSPPSPESAQRNLQTMVKNSLIPPTHAAPFIRPANGPIYPRSCNRSQTNFGRPTSQLVMLKKHLLRNIDRPIQDLAPLDRASILPFGLQQTPVALSPPPVPEHDICYPDKNNTILSSCPGLRKWICRPAFEDRFVIYLAVAGGEVICKPVSSSFGVAALEYSEVLDVMVDPDFELDKGLVADPPSPPVEAAPIKDAGVHLQVTPSPSLNPRRNSRTAIPSPLRNEHFTIDAVNSSDKPTDEPVESSPRPPQEVMVTKATSNTTPVKRVVRFAEDDDDDEDGVPLHVLRMKKKREEKGKFLRLERQRRMREALEEQQRREAEAYEMEKRRVARENERREREKRLYAEQVAASRQRSEQARAGAFALSCNSSSSLLVPPLAHSRESQRNSPRTVSSSYSSPRRDTSDFGQHESSSGSSRPPSRPPSTYSTSSEEARPSSGSRTSSLTPSMRSYPGWSGSTQSLSSMHSMVPMPQLAAFAAANNDMPLLPPTAPFMKRSRQSSPLPDSHRGTSTSSERRQSPTHRSDFNSSLRPEPTSPTSLRSPPSAQYPDSRHIRQSSGDSKNSRHSSMPRPQPPSAQSLPHIARGRPAIPVYQSAPYAHPSPWTALPSRSGTIPQAMPVSSYPHNTGQRNSRISGHMGHDWRSTLIS